jgi:hypothetical protein
LEKHPFLFFFIENFSNFNFFFYFKFSDWIQIRFPTPLTIQHVGGDQQQEDPMEEHMLVHGYPLENWTLTLTRIDDNRTEVMTTTEFRGAARFTFIILSLLCTKQLLL